MFSQTKRFIVFSFMLVLTIFFLCIVFLKESSINLISSQFCYSLQNRNIDKNRNYVKLNRILIRDEIFEVTQKSFDLGETIILDNNDVCITFVVLTKKEKIKMFLVKKK